MALYLTRLTLLISVFLTLGISSTIAAPKADLWSKWDVSRSTNNSNIDYTEWNDFLKKYLLKHPSSGIHRVLYNGVTAQDKETLFQFILKLQSINITHYNRQEQKAYWINLYNAVTVHLILMNYPVDSIRDIDISPGWFSNGPWDAKLLKINGESLSLNDIEHRILRPIWKDNRIHYAVNCASLGCPNLQPIPYTAENTEQLLDQAAIEYINHPRGVNVVDGDMTLSSIYKWYGEDFGRGESDLIRHIKKYAKPILLQKLSTWKGDIDYDYDWNLNQP